ncbi:MAG: hypothetical protein KDM91_04500, partial [Verrucomicrobiae bacterium]|nr:hypothetical protein [Verrucomicrobiae bacterium]
MKGEKLSMFALVFAAVVLLVVGAVSYNNYVRQKYEKEFAQRAYESALASLELARVDADRQHRYLVTIAQPSSPDSATYPVVWRSVL